MLVKRLFASKFAMIKLTSKLATSSANENESQTVNPLTVDWFGQKLISK